MGFLFSKPSQYDPQRDIPDLTGKVAVVTGANSGLGYATASQLALKGARTYCLCRSETRARDAIERLKEEYPALRPTGDDVQEERLVFVKCDLADVRGVAEAARTILSREKRCDFLANVGGILPSEFDLTKDGIEIHVGTNHVGHFILTTLLLPLMRQTASLPGAEVRIATMTSLAYKAVTSVDYTSTDSINAEGTKGSGFWGRFTRYGKSKVMNILFTWELQHRLDAEGIPIVRTTMHPGLMQSEGANVNGPLPIRLVLRYTGITALVGSYSTLFCLTSPEVAADPRKYTGAYMREMRLEDVGLRIPKGEVAEGVEEREGEEMRRLSGRLWEWTREVCRNVLGEGWDES